MASHYLAVAGLGMVSSIGIGSEANAAALRCGYDGFQIPYKGKVRYRHAVAPIDPTIRGFSRLVALSAPAINEALKGIPDTTTTIPTLFCLAEESRPGERITHEYLYRLIDALNKNVSIDLYHPETSYYCAGRTGFASALRDAQILCSKRGHEFVLIVGIDNLTTSMAINHFMGGRHSPCRLLTPDNSDGFIPGEAATAILLAKSGKNDSQTWITGVGIATEPAPLESEDVHTSVGLTDAIRIAANQAGIKVADTDFVVAGISGESWFFTEASNAIHRTMEHTRETHPLWHPSDGIGEVGAAIGPAIVVMAYYAFEKGYAPGSRALCHLSNDDHRRGAFILEHRKRTGNG